MVMDRHWGRDYNQLYRNHNLLGIGVDVNTALIITSSSATVSGANVALVADGRYASYALGTNNALSARYVLLDTYINGDTVTP